MSRGEFVSTRPSYHVVECDTFDPSCYSPVVADVVSRNSVGPERFWKCWSGVTLRGRRLGWHGTEFTEQVSLARSGRRKSRCRRSLVAAGARNSTHAILPTCLCRLLFPDGVTETSEIRPNNLPWSPLGGFPCRPPSSSRSIESRLAAAPASDVPKRLQLTGGVLCWLRARWKREEYKGPGRFPH